MLSILSKLKPRLNFNSQLAFLSAQANPKPTIVTHNAIQEVETSSPSTLSENLEPEKDKLYSRLEIEIKSAEPAVLKSYSWFATTAAQHLGVEVGKCWEQRKPNFDRLTLLKSVHIYKKHRVQYEVRTYYRFMTFHKLTGSTLDTFLEYIQRNLPEGVGMKCTKVELQDIPDHLKEQPSTAS